MRFTALFVFLLGFHFAIGQNLIVNPGAELPPLANGWTQVSGFWTNGIEQPPHGGTYHFYPGDNSLGGSELYQDVNVSAYSASIDLGLSTFAFSTWMRVYNFSGGIWNDRGRTVVEYRNSTGTVLSTYDTGLQSSLTWIQYTDTRTAPVGTRTIRIRLLAARNTGTAADGYFDDLSLTHSTTLPVSLLSFEGNVLDKKIVLTWKTSEENSNDFFTIEKSFNGTDWKTIGIVTGTENSDQVLSYSYADNTPVAGIQYYRLKQTDVSGASAYFKIIPVNYSLSFELTAFPNPTSGSISLLTADTNDGIVRIYSLTGQEVFFKELGFGTVHQLNLNHLMSGSYHLEYSEGGEIFRMILRKE